MLLKPETVSIVADAVFWLVLALGGVCGTIALINPRWLVALNTQSKMWFDTDRLYNWLDKRIEIDHFLIPHARLLGAVLVTSVGAATYRYLCG